MALSRNLNLTWLFLAATTVALLVSTPASVEAEVVDCGTVYNALVPCYTYLLGTGDVSQTCCGGLVSLVSTHNTTGDRQAACACLKAVFPDVDDPQFGRAMDIPLKCGVNLGFQFGRDVNCADIP